MVELKKIVEYQKKFDKKHGWDWSKANEEKKLLWLAEGVICLTGEWGEFANLVKKIRRNFHSLKKLPDAGEYKKLKEELTDVFIYVIKIAGQILNMDLEKEYFKKMKINEEKFRKFEK